MPARSLQLPAVLRSASVRDALVLALLAAGAFVLRTAWLFGRVWTEGGARLQGTDPWYHLRLADHLVQSFPRPLPFDPYLLFPQGQAVAVAPLLDLLVAGTALLLGGGDPSPGLVERVAALAPPVLGALVVVPVYALGRQLFGRGSGLLAAALVALQPGPLLDRSLLGATDHHVLEALLAATTLALLAGALWRLHPESAVAGPMHLWRQALPLALAAGGALGAYLLAWSGGLVLVGLLALWAGLQAAWDEVAGGTRGEPMASAGGRSSGGGQGASRPPVAVRATAPAAPVVWRARSGASRVAAAVVPAFAAAAVLTAPRTLRLDGAHDGVRARAAAAVALLVLALAGLAILLGLARLARRLRVPAWLAPVATAGIGLLALEGALRALPGLTGLAGLVRDHGRLLAPDRAARTVAEVRPLLEDGGLAWLRSAVADHGWGILLAAVGLAALAVRVLRRRRPEESLLLAWCCGAAALALAQRRFGYYLALAVAWLAGWMAAEILRLGRDLARGEPRRRALAYRGAAAGMLVLLLVVPVAGSLPAAARSFDGPSDDWVAALEWMRAETPEPFGDPGAYLDPPGRPPGEVPGAYGVAAWWDYGYWILRISRRIPVANPTQHGAREVARVLVAPDPGEARRRLRELGARYAVVDGALPAWAPAGTDRVQGKLPALAAWAGEPLSRYLRLVYQEAPGGRLEPVVLYLPDYYRTLQARLYLFGGQAVTPRDSTWVVTTRTGTGPEGRPVEVVESSRRFGTHAEAAAFLARAGAGTGGSTRWLAGREPFRSAVPLEDLAWARQVYPPPAAEPGARRRHSVRIFELLPEG